MDILLYNKFKQLDTRVNTIQTDVTNLGNVYAPVTPTITLGINGFQLSDFMIASGGLDSHLSTDWEMYDNDTNQLLVSSYNDINNKLTFVYNFDDITNIRVRARFKGSTFGYGGWGEQIFNSLIPGFSIGTPLAGGYYAGNIKVGAVNYALIVAPKALGENVSLQWKTINTTTSGTSSVWDGWTNTNNMNNSSHPAAQFCRSLNINGYNDWYLPAKDELELLYRNFKPTTETNHTSSGANNSSDPKTSNYTSSNPSQTSLALFKSGGMGAFTAAFYWGSTEYGSNYSWSQYFFNGNQTNFNKNNSYYVRAVRRLTL